MTDANIYRIIDAFREGKKVVMNNERLNYPRPAGTMYLLLIYLHHCIWHEQRWFIDGVEVKE